MNYDYNNSPECLNDIVEFFQHEDEMLAILSLPFVNSKFIEECLKHDMNEYTIARDTGTIYSDITIYGLLKEIDQSTYPDCPIHWSQKHFEQVFNKGQELIFKGLLQSDNHQDFRRYIAKVDEKYRYVQFLFCKPNWFFLEKQLPDNNQISVLDMLGFFKVGTVRLYDVLEEMDVLKEISSVYTKVSPDVFYELRKHFSTSNLEKLAKHKEGAEELESSMLDVCWLYGSIKKMVQKPDDYYFGGEIGFVEIVSGMKG